MKLLNYIQPEKEEPSLAEATLNDAIDCIREAALDLLGDCSEEGAPYHTLGLPAAGRLLAKESVIRKWFREHFEDYAKILAAHLAASPQVGWMDVLSLSVPFRLDRLCLTLSASPAAQEPASGPCTTQMYWNWTGPRTSWDSQSPVTAERRFLLTGAVPNTAVFEAFTKGFHMAGAELALCRPLEVNVGALEAVEVPQLRISASDRPPPAPAPPPPKKPRPTGSSSREKPKEIVLGKKAAGADPLAEPQIEQPLEVRRHPAGYEFEIIDWNDVQLPLGRRVQSKIAALMTVDHLGGNIYWASEEVLEKYPRYHGKIGLSNAGIAPGRQVKMMHFTSQFGRVTLSARQMLWAYWTAEVPEELRRITYIVSGIEKGGTLDGIYNLAARGYKPGNKKEKQLFAEEGKNILSKWRDCKGRETYIILRDRSYSKSISPDYVPKAGSAQSEISKVRKLPEAVAKVFAEKVKRGELSVEEAYRRAMIAGHGDMLKGWFRNNDEKNPLENKYLEVRSWVTEEDRAILNDAYAEYLKGGIEVGVLKGLASTDPALREKYQYFAEMYVYAPEYRAAIIQYEFKRLLAKLPQDYGQEPIDLEALADSRGRPPQ